MEHVFVYGTLKPGEVRWPILAPFVMHPTAGGGEASVCGKLFDTGYGWPAAVFDSAAGTDAVTAHPKWPVPHNLCTTAPWPATTRG